MAEETTTASSSVPYAIICAVGGSAVVGFALVLSLLFSIQVILAEQAGSLASAWHCLSMGTLEEAPDAAVPDTCVQDPDNLTSGVAAGNVVSQLIYDIWMARFSSGTGGIVCIGAFAVHLHGFLHCIALNAMSCMDFTGLVTGLVHL